MTLVNAFVATEGTLAWWLTLPELLLVASISKDVDLLLSGWRHVWEHHLKGAEYDQPTAYRQSAVLAAGIQRRRRNGRMLPLRKAELDRVRLVSPRSILVTLFRRTNQPLLDFERQQRGRDYASYYPCGICRECGRYTSRRLVWGGVCSPCFDRNDDEWSASEATRIFGMSYEQREHLPYRVEWSGFGRRCLYRTSDLWDTLRTIPDPPRRAKSRHAVAVRRSRSTFRQFRRDARRLAMLYI